MYISLDEGVLRGLIAVASVEADLHHLSVLSEELAEHLLTRLGRDGRDEESLLVRLDGLCELDQDGLAPLWVMGRGRIGIHIRRCIVEGKRAGLRVEG